MYGTFINLMFYGREIKMENDQSMHSMIDELKQTVARTLASKFFQTAMFELVKSLLCMRKTPEEIDCIYNKIRDLVGASSQDKSVFDRLTLRGRPLDHTKPLDDELYQDLLCELSLEVLKQELSEDEKKKKQEK